MKATLILVGTKETATASAPSPVMVQVDLSTKERLTVAIGEAIRSLMVMLNVFRKYAPAINIQVDGKLVGVVTNIPSKSNSSAAIFTAINKEVLNSIMSSRFTTEELIDLKHTKDPVVNRISEAFGHKGKSISVTSAEDMLTAKFTVLANAIKASQWEKRKYIADNTTPEVAKALAEKKQFSALEKEAKKLLVENK
jgi:hypothetical protein